MKLVSIIVPIYNTEQFVERCIESLENQSYKPLQIILVDDGSTDKSWEICKKYEDAYDNVEVYHQKNAGVSSARNEGLKHIKGEYLFFVDSDDFVLPDYIKHFMNKGEYSFIGGGYCENPVDGWKLQYENRVLTMEDYRKNLIEYFDKVPSVHVCGNRYLSKIIKEHNVRFDENSRIGEDIRFNVNYFKYVHEIRVVASCEYVYWIHGQSSIHQFYINRLREEREECQARETLLGKSKDFDWVRYIHWYTAMEHYYEYSKKDETAMVAKRKLRETMKDSYFKQCMKWCLKYGTLDMKLLIICAKIGSFDLYKIFLKLIVKLKEIQRLLEHNIMVS